MNRLIPAIPRLALLAALGAGIGFGTTGCMLTESVEKRVVILENLKPEGYIPGRDGSLAIVTRPSYHRPSANIMNQHEHYRSPAMLVGSSELPTYVILSPAGVELADVPFTIVAGSGLIVGGLAGAIGSLVLLPVLIPLELASDGWGQDGDSGDSDESREESERSPRQ